MHVFAANDTPAELTTDKMIKITTKVLTTNGFYKTNLLMIINFLNLKLNMHSLSKKKKNSFSSA